MTAPPKDNVGNAYDLSHSKKATLRRHGDLTRPLSFPPSLYDMERSRFTKSKYYMPFFFLYKLILTKWTNLVKQKSLD